MSKFEAITAVIFAGGILIAGFTFDGPVSSDANAVATSDPSLTSQYAMQVPADLKGKRYTDTRLFDGEYSTRQGSNMLEQAIIDAFPTERVSKRARQDASNAADFVALTINSKGLLCAQPVEMQKVNETMYGVACVLRRDGTGRANYLIDVVTGSVDEI